MNLPMDFVLVMKALLGLMELLGLSQIFEILDDVENSVMAKGVFARTIWVIIRENFAPCSAPIVVQFKPTGISSNVP
jgi:hypothetical protein